MISVSNMYRSESIPRRVVRVLLFLAFNHFFFTRIKHLIFSALHRMTRAHVAHGRAESSQERQQLWIQTVLVCPDQHTVISKSYIDSFLVGLNLTEFLVTHYPRISIIFGIVLLIFVFTFLFFFICFNSDASFRNLCLNLLFFFLLLFGFFIFFFIKLESFSFLIIIFLIVFDSF